MTQANNYLQVCTCADEDDKPCPIHDKPIKGVLTTTMTDTTAGSWSLQPAKRETMTKSELNPYKCKHCGKIVLRNSSKKWIKSSCVDCDDKSVRLTLQPLSAVVGQLSERQSKEMLEWIKKYQGCSR